MLANYAIINMETISPFIDSSINNVMLQTSDFQPGFCRGQFALCNEALIRLRLRNCVSIYLIHFISWNILLEKV